MVDAKLAANEDRDMCRAVELFDHGEPVFESAFRGQRPSKFLHPDIRGFHSLWNILGLRNSSGAHININDYLQCLQTVETRLQSPNWQVEDPELLPDVKQVLSRLINPSFTVGSYSDADWRRISTKRVFRSRRTWGIVPAHRYFKMCDIGAQSTLLSLSDLVAPKHIPICWSQTPFPEHNPTVQVFNCIRKGKPLVSVVWRHLLYLSQLTRSLSQSDVEPFLSDLHRTYAYLQDNIDESKQYFQLQDDPIWLNVDSIDGKALALSEFQGSWLPVKDIMLYSSYDTGRVRAARAGIMIYEKLLKALGCHVIKYSAVEQPEVFAEDSMGAILTKFREIGYQTDITYSSEGQSIKAHRLLLAAVSPKCKAQFSGQWHVEEVIKFDEKEDPDGFLSFHTLSKMIDYAYKHTVDWTDMDPLEDDDGETRNDKLNKLLDLHNGADCWRILALASLIRSRIILFGRMFINIDNVVAVRDRAEDVNATEIAKLCIRFIDENRESVKRAGGA